MYSGDAALASTLTHLGIRSACSHDFRSEARSNSRAAKSPGQRDLRDSEIDFKRVR